MTPLQAAQVCADTYDQAAQWDHFWAIEDVLVSHRSIDGLNVFAFRGSQTAVDWLRDAEGWPMWHDRLGFVHAGVLRGLDAVYEAIKGAAGERNAFVGHSLGGARARVHAAHFVMSGYPVEECHVFGSPRPAFANLRRIIEKSGMKHLSWRNRNDPVPLVPALLPYWEHTEAYGAFDVPADPKDLDPLRDHHMAHYVEGAKQLGAI